MGDETKATEVRKGNTDPLSQPKKPSDAQAVEREPEQVAQMPAAEEVERRDETREEAASEGRGENARRNRTEA